MKKWSCLPTVTCGPVPVGSSLHPVAEILHKIYEHAAARRLDRDDQEAADHLPHTAQKTVNRSNQDANAVPSSEEDCD